MTRSGFSIFHAKEKGIQFFLTFIGKISSLPFLRLLAKSLVLPNKRQASSRSGVRIAGSQFVSFFWSRGKLLIFRSWPGNIVDSKSLFVLVKAKSSLTSCEPPCHATSQWKYRNTRSYAAQNSMTKTRREWPSLFASSIRPKNILSRIFCVFARCWDCR